MTQDTRPMTRRELRLAAASEASSATTVDHRVPLATTPAASSVGDRPVVDLPTVDQPAVDQPAVAIVRATSRRELRAAAAAAAFVPAPAPAPTAACEPPFTVVVQTPADSLPTAPPSVSSFPAQPVLPTQRTRPAEAVSRALTASRVAKAGTVLALSAGLVTSAVALQVENVPGAPHTTMLSPGDLAIAAQARGDAATSERLTAQAAQYAVVERREALAVAEATLADAGTVVSTAATVVDPEVVAVLDEAIAELEAMVASSTVPVPPAEVRAEDSPAIDGESQAGSTPAADVATESPATPSPEDVDDSPAEATARTVDPASRAATSRTPVAERAADDAQTEAEASADDLAEEPDANGSDQAPADAALGAMSLEVTTQVLQTAERVAALTAEVQAAADAEVAEAAAQAAEAAAKKAAEEAAAAELARKSAAAAQYGNGQIPSDLLCAPDFSADELLRCDAADALERLNDAYRADFGRDLDVVSSYRSYSAQVSVRRMRGSFIAAAPGTSNHGLGVAVDFAQFGGLGQFGSTNYRWMRDNAPAFGWEHPLFMRPGGGGPQEPWHWEYVND